MGVFDEIKDSFKQGSVLTKLIYVNLAVFLLVNIYYLVLMVMGINNPVDLYNYSAANWFAVPANVSSLLIKPWTIITYMFLHEDFLHILFNLLWLYWFGRIFSEFLDQKKLLSTYLLGGISGAVFYILAFNLIPSFQLYLNGSVALGASAAILAIVTAASFYMPDYKVYLVFIGPVKLKYIAIVSVIIDLISIPKGNAGGHIAHLGGALYGYIFIMQYKRRNFFTNRLETLLFSFFSMFKPKPQMKASYSSRPMNDMEYNTKKVADQEEINRILDKISKSGYDSLSKDEKEKLFKMSR